MKKAVTILVALVIAAIVLRPAQANAGSSSDAALALGAFAVFNQIFGGYGTAHFVRETVVVQQPAMIYAPPPPPPPAVIYAPPPVVYYAPPPPVVVYPNGYAYGAPYGYGSYGASKYYKHHRKHRHEDDDD